MSEDTELLEKREELKRQLQNGEYDLLPTVILNKLGQIIQKLTRNPEPLSPWISGSLIALLLILIWFLTLFTQNRFDSSLLDLQSLPVIVYGGFLMNILGISTQMLYSTFCKSTLDGMQSVLDLEDLQRLLNMISSWRPQLFVSLATVVYFLITLLPSVTSFFGISFPLGLWISITISAILGSFFFYTAVWYIVLTLRLPQYQFRLYPADPRSSTLIARLSDALQTILLIAAIYAAVGNLIGYLRASEPDSAIPLVTWLAIITAFVVYQRALGRMITHAKWRTLDDIQSKVQRLQTMQDIPDKETLEQMRSLMDYHDYVKAKPDSLLNLREGLKLVNALLLPLLALVLGNWTEVLALLRSLGFNL